MLDYSTAPNQDMVPGIKRYVEHGIMPGGFMDAVFSSELINTFAHADKNNFAVLTRCAKDDCEACSNDLRFCHDTWLGFLWWEMPDDIVGSRAKMRSHVNRKRKERHD